jgi:hypothetical protein
MTDAIAKPRKAHIWAKQEDSWYVEPQWCSARLFDAEYFDGAICDPTCGIGQIPESAIKAGYTTIASDLVDRGYRGPGWRGTGDFLASTTPRDAIVCNPPYGNLLRLFIEKALSLVSDHGKVAMFVPTARLHAAHWLTDHPLSAVYFLSPRPSCPPGPVYLSEYRANGKAASGDTKDYSWWVFEKGYNEWPRLAWLRRGKKNPSEF